MRQKPKKRLGQHFLVDAGYRQMILDACSLHEQETVLEIGPGRGEMTAQIAVAVKHLVVVELDRTLAAMLGETFKKNPSVEVLNQDILKTDLIATAKRLGAPLTVVGNIPYYISTPILEHLIAARCVLRRVHLLLQKEYAERLVSPPGSRRFGSLSCFAQYYTEPQLQFVVPRRAFYPVPKVDSAFVRIQPRQEVLFSQDACAQRRFFTIIHCAFSQRRKMLRNALKEEVDPALLQAFLAAEELSPRVRPEEVQLEQFARLTRMVCAKEK